MRAAATLLCLALAAGVAAPAAADPVPYRLDAAQSRVGFETDFGPDVITGTFPVESADIALDFERPDRSRVQVTIDVTGAQASFPFATQALTGPRVLDAATHPTIAFESTALRALGGDGARAEIDGRLTIRGVTRPVTLAAEIFRPEGAAPGDRSRLSVHLRGTVSRAAFGATGWSDMVGDAVRLIAVVRIDRAG